MVGVCENMELLLKGGRITFRRKGDEWKNFHVLSSNGESPDTNNEGTTSPANSRLSQGSHESVMLDINLSNDDSTWSLIDFQVDEYAKKHRKTSTASRLLDFEGNSLNVSSRG
jgi:hypothetical protein